MNTSSIKTKAKSLLEGRVFSIFVFIFLITAIPGIIFGTANKIPVLPQTVTVPAANGQPQQYTVTPLACIIAFIITGPFAFAAVHGMLKYGRNKKATVDIIGEIKNAFSGDNFMRSIVAYLRISIFTSLWSMLFVIPGIYKAIQYSQTMRILTDDNKITPAEAQKKSMEIMKGHTWDYIKLILSFFGWYIVIICTLGLASIYVEPYMELANVVFYDSLRKK